MTRLTWTGKGSGSRRRPELGNLTKGTCCVDNRDQLAFKNFFEVAAWLFATSGGLYVLHFTLTLQFAEGSGGMDPASFAFFSFAFIALNLRYFRLFPNSMRAVEPLLSRALAVVLCAFITLRIIESVAGTPFSFLSLPFGDAFSGGTYAPWGTASGILILFGIATFVPGQPRPLLFWMSYSAYWLIVTLCVHQLLHVGGLGTAGFSLPGVSALSAISLLCLAGVVLPRSPFWAVLFDTRTPRSNTAVLSVMLLIVASIIAEAAMVEHFGMLEALGLALLLVLPSLSRILRGREIEVLIAAGKLTKAGKPVLTRTVPDMRPLPDVKRSFWGQLLFDYAFVKPVWVQDIIHAVATAALALGSIILSSMGDERFATIWPVNAFLAYWLVVNPVSRWPRILGYFYITLLSVNLGVGSQLQVSAMLGGLNAIEGVALALLIRQIYGLRVQNRVVHIDTLTITQVAFSVLGSLIALALTSMVGGGIVTYAFGGEFMPNAWIWFFASAVGSAMLYPIALGYLMEVHWGFPPLRSVIRQHWLILLPSWIAFWVALPFAANVAIGFPMLTYLSLALLGLLFSSLWRAGVHFAVLSILFVLFRRFLPATLELVEPTFLVVQLTLLMIIMVVFVVRKQQERAQREIDLIAAEGPGNIVTLDYTGAIVTCSQPLSLMTGQDKVQLIGQNLYDVLQIDAGSDGKPSVPAAGTTRWHVNIPGSQTRAVDLVVNEVTDQTMPFAFICSVRDRTEALAAEEARIAQIERSTAIIVTQDAEWTITHCSDGWCAVMGYTREETVGRDLNEFIADDSQRELGKVERGAKPTDAAMGLFADSITHYGFRTKTGEVRVLLLRAVFTGSQPDCVTTTGIDITSELRERAEKETAYKKLQVQTEELKAQSIELKRSLDEQKRVEETARTYLDISEGFSALQNEKFEIIQMSQPMLDLLGYDRVEDLPEISSLRADDLVNLSERRTEILATPVGVSIKPYTVSYWTKTGDKRTFQIRGKWYPTIDGRSRVVSSIFEDITLLQEQAEALERQAETDPLTGILNRLGVQKRLGDDLASLREKDWVLCLVDIDFFKLVNDTYSHRVGDELIQAAAKTLQTFASEDGLAVRLGGEEFLVAMPWTSEEEAHALGEQVRQAIGSVALQTDGFTVSRTASVGVARLGKDDTFSHSLHNADLALTEAKETGRNNTVLADQAFLEKQYNRGAFITEHDIVRGIKNGEFVYYVQPIYNTRNNQVEGFEALIRWQQADGTVQSPAAFLSRFQPIFYRSDYLEVRQAMRRDVLQGLSAYPETYVSWNLDLKQFVSGHFVTDVIRTAAELQATSPHPLVLELSEDKLDIHEDLEAIFANLQKLRDAGIKIALDDFGSKDSNIHRLSRLPVDIVKLDKSLIDNIEHSSREYATLRGLALLLEQMAVEVIAEGVETSAQARLLNDLNIYKHQGYLYGKPTPPAEFQIIEADLGTSSDTGE